MNSSITFIRHDSTLTLNQFFSSHTQLYNTTVRSCCDDVLWILSETTVISIVWWWAAALRTIQHDSTLNLYIIPQWHCYSVILLWWCIVNSVWDHSDLNCLMMSSSITYHSTLFYPKFIHYSPVTLLQCNPAVMMYCEFCLRPKWSQLFNDEQQHYVPFNMILP